MRSVGAVDAAQAAVPESLTPLVVALTHLGDPVVVLGVLALVYWVGPPVDLLDRPAGIRLLAVGFTALGLVLALKAAFGLPRPPTSLHRVATDGTGFPSGHATAAAAAYGGLALYVDRWEPTRRWAAAAAVIGVVALSRVVLGLHYLVDVVAGVGVGLAVVAVTARLARTRAGRGLWLATAVGAAAVAAAGATVETATALAGSGGAATAWVALRRRSVVLDDAWLPGVLLGGAVAVGATAVVLATEPPLPVAFAVTGATGVAVVGLPALRTSRGTALSPTR